MYKEVQWHSKQDGVRRCGSEPPVRVCSEHWAVANASGDPEPVLKAQLAKTAEAEQNCAIAVGFPLTNHNVPQMTLIHGFWIGFVILIQIFIKLGKVLCQGQIL